MVKKKSTKTTLKELAANIPIFRKIRQTRKKGLHKLISSLSPEQMHAVCTCIYNTLHMNLGIPQSKTHKLKKTLSKNSEVYHYLADKRNPLNKKRKLIVQHGGSIGLILSLVIPVIQGIVSLFSKKKK